MQLTINFIHCSYQADPTTFLVPKVIHPSATRYPQKKHFLTMARISIIGKEWISDFNACAKVCLKFRKFSKLPNFERDKYVSVKSSTLLCSQWIVRVVILISCTSCLSLASGMLIMLT